MHDRAAFEGWIEAHYRALYRHALWMTGDAATAADLVQEAYYQAWKARHTLRDEAKAFAWLLTILRRRVFEEYGRTASWNECTERLVASLASAEDVHDLLDLERPSARLQVMGLMKTMFPTLPADSSRILRSQNTGLPTRVVRLL